MKEILLFLAGLIIGMAVCYGAMAVAMAVGWSKLRWRKEAKEFFEWVEKEIEGIKDEIRGRRHG